MASDAVAQSEAEIRQTINTLYQLLGQAYEYDPTSSPAAIHQQIASVLGSLHRLQQASSNLSLDVPVDVIQYIEQGRNPDIYTREFVEATQRLNQERKGRVEAYTAFRDVLGNEIANQVPDLKKDVEGVLRRTGGGSLG